MRGWVDFILMKIILENFNFYSIDIDSIGHLKLFYAWTHKHVNLQLYIVDLSIYSIKT